MAVPAKNKSWMEIEKLTVLIFVCVVGFFLSCVHHAVLTFVIVDDFG